MACSNNDECMAFEADSSGGPKCLIMAGTEIEELSSSSDTVYLKRETLAGETFKFGNPHYGACSVSCDGGILVPIFECINTADVTVKAGMCTNLAAMNPDAIPHKEIECNTEECPEIEHPLGDDCKSDFQGCMELPEKDYYFHYYPANPNPRWTICPTSLRVRKPWTWNQYKGFNYYYHTQEDGEFVRVPESGIIEYAHAWYYYGWGYSARSNIVPPTYLQLQCADAGSERFAKQEIFESQPYTTYYGNTYYYQVLTEIRATAFHPCACAADKKK